MKRRSVVTLAVFYAMSAGVFAATKPMVDSEVCAVWHREKSFADALEKHDAKSFAEHIDPNAIFLDNQGKQAKGRDAVTAEWADLLGGAVTTLRWQPRDVAIDHQRGLAVSRGPYTVRPVHPEPGKPEIYGGIFSSFWIKDDDGVWRVLFDAGSGPRAMTTEEETQHMKPTTTDCPNTEPVPSIAPAKGNPPTTDPIEQVDPRFSKQFDNLYQTTWGDGAIPSKYKHLAGISISVVERCETCLYFHMKSAKAAGATRPELIEALRLGTLSGGSITIPTLRQGALKLLEFDRSNDSEAH